MTPEYIASKLALLPQFKVISIDHEPKKQGKGFTVWGRFSEPVGRDDQTTNLYLPDLRGVEGLLLSAPEEQAVRQIENVWIAYEHIPEIELLSQSFSYFGSNDARRLRLVIDPDILWTRSDFQSRKAVQTRIVGTDGKPYLRLTPYPEGSTGTTRYYPLDEVKDLELADGETIVEAGWDHEHCVFCCNTIDMDNAGYYSEHNGNSEWVCEWCYRNSVEPHDPRPLLTPYASRDFGL